MRTQSDRNSNTPPGAASRLPLSASPVLVGLAFLVATPAQGSLEPQRRDIRLDDNRFMPAMVSARAGDTLVFTNGRGGPHNVQFADDSLTDGQHRLIDSAMPERPKVAWSRDIPLAGPLLVLEGDTYTVAVPALPPGRYRFFCTPHYAGGMRGELTVVP